MNRHEQWREWYENEKKQPESQKIYQKALELDKDNERLLSNKKLISDYLKNI